MIKKIFKYRLFRAWAAFVIVFLLTIIVPSYQYTQKSTDLKIQKEEVILDKHIDGDTTRFIAEGESIKVRYLAIDTQETVHPTKEATTLGYTASDYVKEKLENATKIELEFDPESDKEDKYGRILAWVWVDDTLLQEELVSKGLAEVKYIYGNYKYLNKLEAAQQEAKDNKLGIWSEVANE